MPERPLLDDVLRAAGLYGLGDDPAPEASAAVLARLRALAPVTADDAGGEAVGRIMSDVQPVMVSWLWPGRVPLGRLTILDGDPGLGKSSVTLDLAARVTRGDAMPDGARGLSGPAGVVLLGAEDGLADTVRPRLDAAGADCERVYALTGARVTEGRPRLPTIQDVAAIREAAERVGAVLLIVDPLSAYMGAGVDGHRDIDVRTALAALAALAEATGLAVLLVRHLRKSGGASPLYVGGGSIAIIAAARSGLLLARDPDDADRLVLATTKGNLAPPQPSLSLRLATTGDALRVEWGGVSSRTAADLLVTEDDEQRGARDCAVELLREVLADGPRPLAELQRMAGVSRRTMYRARQALGIVAEPHRDPEGRVRGWVWRLPSHGAMGPGTLDGGTLASTRTDTSDSPYPRSPGSQGPALGTLDAPRGRPSAHGCRDCGIPIGPTAELCAPCRYPELRRAGPA